MCPENAKDAVWVAGRHADRLVRDFAEDRKLVDALCDGMDGDRRLAADIATKAILADRPDLCRRLGIMELSAESDAYLIACTHIVLADDTDAAIELQREILGRASAEPTLLRGDEPISARYRVQNQSVELVDAMVFKL